MSRRRILLGFIAAFVVQGLLLFYVIGDRALLLARGAEVRLKVVPVDPRDFFRGDYVILAYDISRIDADKLAGDDEFFYGDSIYVTLEKSTDAWEPVAITHLPPKTGLVLKGSVTDVTDNTEPATQGGPKCDGCYSYRVTYGLEQFFVPEGEGRELEKLRNDQKLEVDVAVGKGGRAALKRLLVDGAPQYEDPLF